MPLLRLANRLILDNSSDTIDPEDRRRVAISCGPDEIEAWVSESRSATPDVFCLKFPGTGGRAERAGPHPAEAISPGSFEVWTINPPGYGTSSGSACVSKMPLVCDSTWQAIFERANGKPIIVTGNSLGCLYALYVAARFSCAGIMLRNPAPVPQLIRGKYSWWNFGLANLVGKQIPSTMDAINNAISCQAPALFVTSEDDRMIPPRYQQMVFDAYSGDSETFTIRDADHHTPVPENQIQGYKESILRWKEKLQLKDRG